jgi:hypothetical protein
MQGTRHSVTVTVFPSDLQVAEQLDAEQLDADRTWLEQNYDVPKDLFLREPEEHIANKIAAKKRARHEDLADQLCDITNSHQASIVLIARKSAMYIC